MLDQAAANGTAVADVINFNLSPVTEASKTIILLSALPAVSSNLTIDGASQPGAPFGVSTAKVKILMGFAGDGAIALLLYDVENVTIYGLYIKNEQVCPSDQHCISWQGIAVRDSRNISIGAAGKGNVILGFYENIGMNMHYLGGQIHHYSVGVSLKANFIGVEPDGITQSTVQSNPLSLYYVIGALTIGGTPAEGNVLPSGLSIIQANSQNYIEEGVEMYVTPCFINIKNNKVGLDFFEKHAYTSSGIHIATHSPNGKNTIFIEDNVISSSTSYAIHISNNLHETNIRRNYIGTNRSLTKVFPVGDIGIFVHGATNVKIGSNDAADKNYLTNCKPVYVWPYSTVSVNKNSFFCVQDTDPMVFDTYGTFFHPKINISSVTATSVNGTATPNSTIELFYADQCGTCAPETYFGSTIANTEGNWHYEGTIKATVIASSTLNGATSNFTQTKLDLTNAVVENTCPDYGSIKGVVPLNYSNISWVNEAGKDFGASPDLLNVPIGKYKLKIENGNCSTESPWYEIKRGLSINPSGIVVNSASCNEANGSIKGLNVINYTTSTVTYTWSDDLGREVGTSVDLPDVKPGKYMLSVKLGDNSCVLPYGPVEVRNVNGVAINGTKMVVKPSICGNSDGSITGIEVKGLGQLKYKWKDESGSTVSASLDLTSMTNGKYTLEVSDESSCVAVFTTIDIPEINQISLSNTGVIQPATCGLSNGSITSILVTGAIKYEWFDRSSSLISTSSSPELINVKAGDYYLVASNANCRKTSKIYTISGTGVLAAPRVADVQLCAGGDAVLIVNEVLPGRSYRLYVDKTSSIPLLEERSGRFSIRVNESCQFYASQYEAGCESPRTRVEVTVSSSAISIPSSFSPNGDGINDTWLIKGLENHAKPEIVIVNRYGAKVYQSSSYQIPFDGKLNGKLLSPGVYYYMIKLGIECRPVSGSITLLN
jgi:gliding motility-associated-like protein